MPFDQELRGIGSGGLGRSIFRRGICGRGHFFGGLGYFGWQLGIRGLPAVGDVKAGTLEDDGDGYEAAIGLALALGAGRHAVIIESLPELKIGVAF